VLDKALAALSIACLLAFVAVLIGFIGEIDLAIVTLAVVILAAVDFYLLTRSGSKTDGRPSGR